MPRYSVATTKDNLSSLIDKAMAGEEVIVTRHGKPTISFRTIDQRTPTVDVQSATARLQATLAGKRMLAIPTSYFREWLYGEDDY